MQEADISKASQPQVQVVVGKPVHRHWATWLLAALLVLSLAGNGYLYMQFDKTKKDLDIQRTQTQHFQDEASALKSRLGGEATIGENEEISNQETDCTYMPDTALLGSIKDALDSKNTGSFATYTTDPVQYVLAASEFGGNTTPDEAAANLAYTHSATGPWTSVPASDYGTGDYNSYFGDKTEVFKSADGMVVAFDFNCDGSKIAKIFVAPSEDLL